MASSMAFPSVPHGSPRGGVVKLLTFSQVEPQVGCLTSLRGVEWRGKTNRTETREVSRILSENNRVQGPYRLKAKVTVLNRTVVRLSLGNMAGTEVSNKQVLLKKYVVGWPTEADMELVTTTKKLELKAGTKDVLVKVLYLSCDPYMRGRMRDNNESYIAPFTLGQPLMGYGLGKVVLSNDPAFVENDYVWGFMGWEEYSLGYMLKKIDKTVLPLSYWLGALGMPGFTAYVGFFGLSAPKAGETVYVSAAAGAVGQMVGQFAKLAGCYVVGSAGSQEKIDLLKSKFKYDEAFNYKEETDLDATLKKYCPNGIDIYFENVGGKMLDAVLLNMNVHGRIPVCGMISQYNLEDPQPIYNIQNIIKKRIKMQGFLQSDHFELLPEFKEKVVQWFVEKKLEYVEDIANGLEEGPKAFIGMLAGKNVGKQSVKVADDV